MYSTSQGHDKRPRFGACRYRPRRPRFALVSHCERPGLGFSHVHSPVGKQAARLARPQMASSLSNWHSALAQSFERGGFAISKTFCSFIASAIFPLTLTKPFMNACWGFSFPWKFNVVGVGVLLVVVAAVAAVAGGGGDGGM